MDGHDVRDILQMRTYFVEIQSVRGLLQQHFQRIVQQLHRTWNHQQRDQAAGDGYQLAEVDHALFSDLVRKRKPIF